MHDAPMIRGVVITHHSKPRKRSEGLLAMVDTGSDVSIVPDSMRKIGLQQSDKGGLIVSQENGVKALRPVPFYHLCFELCGTRILTKWAMFGQENYIKLGRDVLSRSTLKVCWAKEKKGLLELYENGTATSK